MEYTGRVVNVRFYNEETKYIVCTIETSEGDHFTATGNMSYVNVDDQYKFTGEYVVHPKYGKQFKIESYEIILANEESAVIRYLSSSLFKGIGKKQATIIVEALGEDALTKIKENPSSLDTIKGMTQQKKQVIVDVLNTQSYDQEVLNFFVEYDIPVRFMGLIQSAYQQDTISVIKDDPYTLIEDIDGMGFKTCDAIALKLGFELHDERRIQAAISYALKELCYSDGSTYELFDEIYNRTQRYLNDLSSEDFETYLNQCVETKSIIRINDFYYPKDLYESEKVIAKNIHRYVNLPEYPVDEKELNRLIENLESQYAIKYDDLQVSAIEAFLKQSIMILTGGPGTGKTTIVEAIIKTYRALNPDQRIAMVAPTGRAAKRLSEVTGLEACTIHRLLKWDFTTNTFAKNEDSPLDYDVLVIDEFSMVDSLLFSNILKACRRVSRILLIGDDQQLPSVSPGNVLKDLLESELIYHVKLNHIYRQSDDSGIIHLAHDIRNDQYDYEVFENYLDIHYATCLNTQLLEYVQTIVSRAIEQGYTQEDIQVLAPMYQGIAGIDALNEVLRQLFNPSSPLKQELVVGRRTFREGDKVLQLKNRVEDNVFNGDIGEIVEIGLKDNFEYTSDTIICDFDGVFVEYTGKDLYDLTHAYCMSIHKSQGNEFKIVIMPVLNDYYIMLRKNLIYTGITRAKQSLFVLGNHQAFIKGIENITDNRRHTTLQEALNTEEHVSIYDFM